MSKTLPEYNSLVRWTVNDVCLWLMENGFSNFVRNFRESGIDGSRLADLTNTELQRMRCPFNKQSELLRCVKAIERKEPSRPQGTVRLKRIFRRKSITELVNFSLARVQNIVNRPPPRQPEPPIKDYTAPPPVPTNGYESDEGSGPDDDMWPSDFSDDVESDDQDYENETANELHQKSPAAPDYMELLTDTSNTSHLVEDDVYDAPFEEKEETTARIPSRSTSHSIVDKLKFELQKRSKKENVPSEDSDSEGSYEEPAGPPGPSHGHRPPPPLPSQYKPTPKPQQAPAVTTRKAPPPPKEEEQLVYEEVEETETTQQKPPKPQIMHRRPPAETPHVEETQDVYDDPDNPTVQTQLPVPSSRQQHTSPSVPRRQPPPIPVQSQTSIPDHPAPPLPPNAKNKLKPPPPLEETQDVYEIPNAGETSPTDQPAYLDMQKPQVKEEQELYELPEQDEKSTQKTTPKSKVVGGVSILPGGITANFLKKGPVKAVSVEKSKHDKEKKETHEEKKQKSVKHQPLPTPPSKSEEEKTAPNRPLPTKPQSESSSPAPRTKTDKHIPVPRPPGKKDATLSRPLPTLPTPDDNAENIFSFPWFHQIDRKEADRKLKEHGTTGVFLIRNSSKANQPYTLALLYEDNVFNLPIRLREDHKYAMGNPKKHEQGFDKVSQLVEFFSSHTLILSGKTSGVRLKIPLPK